VPLRRVRHADAPARGDAEIPKARAALACVLATGASAFLLFQIQPILSKALLPRFGGSASVWNACLVFFQTMLLAGYALAHAAARSPRWGVAGLIVVAVAAALALPVAPAAREVAPSHEVAAILITLARTVALPFLLLATAAPTLQRWYAAAGGGATTYRLYSVSNAAALAALLSYPFFWEVRFAVGAQLQMWSMGFACFALLYVGLGLRLERGVPATPRRTAVAADTASLSWVVLPALTSALLMAVTEHVCRELTVVPFLWVVPLALYLLSFAMAFTGDDVYPRVLAPVTVCSLLALLSLAPELHRLATVYFGVRIPSMAGLQTVEARSTLYLAFFFAATFFCHCELYRRRPHTTDLTRYYLAISAGGALGGMFVALACPVVFSDYFELPLLSLSIFALAAFAVVARALHERSLTVRIVATLIAAGAVFLVGRAELRSLWAQPRGSFAMRTFHGVLRVVRGEDTNDGAAYVALYHGGVLHGLQYTSPERRREPTTYYSRDGGAGIAIAALGRDKGALHVGVVGLGAGTLAAYQRPADVYRFYELDGAVERLARTHFDFLGSAPGETHVEIGDGRLLLERAAPSNFDVLLIDAFSGDSVPAHLLTLEAFTVYLRHVTQDGVIGVHVSNRHLRLSRVALGAARQLGLAAAQISTEDGDTDSDAGSDWVLLSRREDVLRSFATAKPMSNDMKSVLWTDQSSNLFAILR
jgi:hypothetical protein